ncbi:ribonuclease Z [Pantoea sp. BS_4]|uniref:Ribonuclease BN n=1 Tax=Pantoea stewartii TaxID=66269 RepID=A0AB34VCW9_9GAMM|nr:MULTISPECIES: ribonuclease Z [Pantoea]KKW51755.1 ribonuclease Z [Pantoea ananatis]KGD84676.1 ribonuclease Z [Pantoea stewartii subsp. indologenes]KHE02950.1 ribonuclease Z [Pantoea stewartii]KHN60091.1 ribonuclease Z [Pantoea stewartii]KTS29213.1 ribonuclease Z [Pantoea stewartii]
MYLTFLGTGGGAPSLQRNVTAIAFTRDKSGATWLFDCGEGTQLQFMRSDLKPGKLDKIFITHLHGDHIFGLPGLLTSRSMAGLTTPMTVYGPAGLKAFVETALSLSSSYTDYPLEIVEIAAGEVLDDGEFRVTAWPMNHTIACFGYRIEQHDKPGFLDAPRLKAEGVPRGPWYQQLKQGDTITLEDGRTVNGAEYLGPPVKGKTLAIFGDTAPTDVALQLAADVDVMVHETTLEEALAEKANGRGHSTTLQAATVAKQAGAKRLIATHFSSRYLARDMARLLAECQRIFPDTEMAHDLAVFTL